STAEHTFGMGEDWVRPPARALRRLIPTGPPGGGGTGGADAPARPAGEPHRPAVVAQRREQPSSKRPGARSTRAGGTNPSRHAVVAQGTERPPPQRQGARSSRAGGTANCPALPPW